MRKSTINLSEVAKFGKMAHNWWNEKHSDVRMLHKMNPIRLMYILQNAEIQGAKVLEVGCGGGILSIPIARIGADLVALEPAIELFDIARLKADEENLKITFLNVAIEDLKFEDESFDTILLMDVVEHVEDVHAFLQIAERLLKQGGKIIISTINNTFLSKIFVKFVAEDVVRIVPRGTHDVKKFISPESICQILTKSEKRDLSGFSYNPISSKFTLSKSSQMNYFLTLQKC